VEDRLCEVFEDSQSSDPHVQRVNWVHPLCTLEDLQDMDDQADAGQEVRRFEDEQLVSIGCC
jgi:hypothetical protein